ncbi:FecR family protein [Maribacter sp. 2304DJ31-5]|uniref:FecR family protein n=1 Tax=Maribacter sp. 2304DJ31-5 TaxID=3386273 RepID=UPI0039BD6B0D
MNKKQAKRLFEKYVNNECSEKELELLHRFLDSYQKDGNAWSVSEYGDKDELLEKMFLKIKAEVLYGKKQKNRSISSLLKYAAILIAIIGIAIFFQYKNDGEKSQLVISDEAIVLKLGNNKTKVISSDGTELLVNAEGEVIGSQNGNQLTYTSNAGKNEEVVYNEIVIPKGKRFRLTLSDGTLVYLNAETVLRYPENFIEGKERKVFLHGEAYFDVTKDTAHPFVVNTDAMGVTVLGTEFNVNTYKKSEPFTVLVEGSVNMYSKNSDEKGRVAGKTTLLSPGQKGSFVERRVEITEVDVSNYIDWREGKLAFDDMLFMDIVNKIERKYNVSIENKHTELNGYRFKGRFEDETIIDLMDVFKESVGFDYQIVDNKIIITKP